MSKQRKSIDLPEKEFRKIQLLAIKKGIPVKKFIEFIILDALKHQENIKIVTSKNKQHEESI